MHKDAPIHRLLLYLIQILIGLIDSLTGLNDQHLIRFALIC